MGTAARHRDCVCACSVEGQYVCVERTDRKDKCVCEQMGSGGECVRWRVCVKCRRKEKLEERKEMDGKEERELEKEEKRKWMGQMK